MARVGFPMLTYRHQSIIYVLFELQDAGVTEYCDITMKDDPMDFLMTLQPKRRISDVKDIVDSAMFLTEAGQVTGEVLHADGGAHVCRW
jgi:enoyl-[acyl-carrier-protein] reductase (NADH)